MRVLVTGFGPFLDVTENPSAILAAASGCPNRILEVSYDAVDAFIDELDQDSFDGWLMLGVAANRTQVNMEMQAKNQRSGRDVRGVEGTGAIDPSQSAFLHSSLWNLDLIDEIVTSFPGEIGTSTDAGGYLCNYLLFRALNRFPQKIIGFMHVVPFGALAQARQSAIIAAILERL